MERAILITGASSGIGRAAAIALDRLGFRVFAGVRKPADGAGLRAEASDRVRPILLDVTDPGAIVAARQAVDEACGDRGLCALVNNAGAPAGGPIEFVPLEEVRRLFEINVFGAIALTQALLPALRRARGRVINIGSMGGMLSPPFNCPYTASKYAMEAWTDSLRAEVRPQGILVSLIQPGVIATPIWGKLEAEAEALRGALPAEAWPLYGAAMEQAKRAALRRGTRGIPADRVARAIVHAVRARRPRTRYRVGADARAAGLLRFLPDGVRDSLFALENALDGR